jgi:hypothetical protein
MSAASPLFLPTSTLTGWETLDDAVSSQHATIEGTHSSVLLSQQIRCICKIRLIFPAVYEDMARVARRGFVDVVHRITPPSTQAETSDQPSHKECFRESMATIWNRQRSIAIEAYTNLVPNLMAWQRRRSGFKTTYPQDIVYRIHS